jgi:hypothetical protein
MDDLTPEQRQAAEDLRAGVLAAAPQMYETARAAYEFFLALMSQKSWHIAESPLPPEVSNRPDQDLWSIGAPRLRHFDKDGNEVPQL